MIYIMLLFKLQRITMVVYEANNLTYYIQNITKAV